jgi:MFS family permease
MSLKLDRLRSAFGETALHRIGILRPLRVRDFRLLWSGMTVSALGDGIYIVALAWQVYTLHNTPTALSIVGVAWFLPQIAATLFGGVIADRIDRRRVMIFADVVRSLAIGTIGVLSVSGHLQLWHMWVLVALYGAGNAVFYPAYTALVPQVLSKEMLVEAAALRQFMRPLAYRIIGPALGGALVAALGAGTGFLIDAGSFTASTVAILLMQARPILRPEGKPVTTMFQEMREGLAFVRSQRWLSTALVAVILAMLFYLGPYWVLVPFVVKNELHGGAGGLGLVLTAGGVGAVLASLTAGQRGFTRRPLVIVYLTWALAAFGLVGYSLVTHVWEAALVSAVAIGSLVTGQILWEALLQRCVPDELLGRVSSVDSFVSSGLVPLSLAITGPVAASVGAIDTLRWAGVIAGGILLSFLLLSFARNAIEAHTPEPAT